jgi:hypothetical protein
MGVSAIYALALFGSWGSCWFLTPFGSSAPLRARIGVQTKTCPQAAFLLGALLVPTETNWRSSLLGAKIGILDG